VVRVCNSLCRVLQRRLLHPRGTARGVRERKCVSRRTRRAPGRTVASTANCSQRARYAFAFVSRPTPLPGPHGPPWIPRKWRELQKKNWKIHFLLMSKK
jgi:hypothetical protein